MCRTRLPAPSWSLTLLAALSLGCLPGCGPTAPKTYAVTGKVVLKGGGKLHGLAIEFQSVADPNVRALGDINPDNGSFKMVSVLLNRGKEGVVEGEHRVRVFNPLNEKSRVVQPKFQRFDTSGITVTVPTDKEVVIEVLRGSGPGADPEPPIH